MRWIITANSNSCRFYECQKNEPLKLIKVLDHPENKSKLSEFAYDRPGHYKTSTPARGAFEPHTNTAEVLLDQFAREIGDTLDKARRTDSFNELIMIMPSEVYGALHHHLNKNVEGLIKKTLYKNIMEMPERDLLNYVKESLKKK